MAIVAESARLAMRHIDGRDAPFIAALMNEPAYLANIGDRGVRTESDAAAYIEASLIALYRTHGFGLYLVTEKATGEPVGISGLLQRPYLEMPDVGYGFLARSWGQGYAVEAGLAVCRDARDRLGLTQLLGFTKPENAPSCRVLERLGFRFERLFEPPTQSGLHRLYRRDRLDDV